MGHPHWCGAHYEVSFSSSIFIPFFLSAAFWVKDAQVKTIIYSFPSRLLLPDSHQLRLCLCWLYSTLLSSFSYFSGGETAFPFALILHNCCRNDKLTRECVLLSNSRSQMCYSCTCASLRRPFSRFGWRKRFKTCEKQILYGSEIVSDLLPLSDTHELQGHPFPHYHVLSTANCRIRAKRQNILCQLIKPDVPGVVFSSVYQR